MNQSVKPYPGTQKEFERSAAEVKGGEKCAEQVETKENQSCSGDKSLPSMATILRCFGGFLVVASGLLYMLQGLADANIAIRDWVYLVLMAVLATGGIFSHRLMHDDKGARLFFALATVLVPVQFSQVAAIIHDFVFHSGVGVELPMSLIQLLILALLTVLLGSLSSCVGLKILARRQAKQLSLSFLGFNVLLLIPMRDFGSVMIIGGFIVAAYWWLETRIFSKDHRFSMPEGVAVRGMLALPLAILLARSGFHYSQDLGVYSLMLQAALLGNYVNNKYVVSSRMADLLRFGCYLLSCWATLGSVTELLTGQNALVSIDDDFIAFLYLAPILVISLITGTASSGRPLYRAFACIAYVLLTWWVILIENSPANLVLLLSSVGLVLHSVQVRSKALLVCFSLGAVVCLSKMLFESLHGIDINAWLVLAIAGVVLVALSSIAERYGRPVLERVSLGYAQFQSWNI